MTESLPNRPIRREEYRQIIESDRVEDGTVLEDAEDGKLILAFALAVDGRAEPCVYLSALAGWECGRGALAPPGV